MELKLTKESIRINEVVYDGCLEQSLELDYLLPDYCPSIFKVLKCKIIPKITSERIGGGKLTIDGVAFIKIIYVSEENHRIRSLCQKQVFSKSVDLKDNCDDGVVRSHIQCDHINCRVVNQRRLDIRGSVSIKATVTAIRTIEVLGGVSGSGIQINNQQITALDRKLCASKEFTIREDLELAYGKPAIGEVLDSSTTASLTEYKLIANKIIVKGEILLHTLYCPDDENADPEIMDFTIPISQIVDLPGVTEDHQCTVRFDVTGVELSPKQNADGECRCFDTEFCVRVCCEAEKNADVQLISDIYSTGYELQSTCQKVKIEQLVCVMNEICTCKASLPLPQDEIACVYDISCNFSSESCRFEEGRICISGNLNISVLALNNENMPVMIDKSSHCEMHLNAPCPGEDVVFSPFITICAISYNLLSGSEIEIRADIRVCGNLYQCCWYNMVSSVTADEEHKKQRRDDAVLRLYFAEQGERVWDIAKRFNTSMDAVLSENNLETDTLGEAGMLLIPIID